MNREELETKIKYYADAYYKGNPIITDSQFDALVDRLRFIAPDSPMLATGWGFTVKGNKVKHKYAHIGSLDKCKTFEMIPDRFKNKRVYISPKLDGLSAVVYYENGQLVKAITRGNGEYGKDITNKLRGILGINIKDNTFTGSVRGELIIHNSYWEQMKDNNPELIAPRNYAAGIINRDEIDSQLQYLSLVVYKIIGHETDEPFSSRQEILKWLDTNFIYSVPMYYYPILNEETWKLYHETTFSELKMIGFGLDGLVLTQDDVIYDVENKAYKYDEVAYKFDAETTTTKVKNIEWTLSRTQRLIPVAEIEPVELSGAIVKRATCNNAKWVEDMHICKGSTIEIQRSGEVIPNILQVIDETTWDGNSLPKNCPRCGELLTWDGVDLKCNNKNCLNVNERDLRQWCENIGRTDGLQWTLMKQYLNQFEITNVEQLYMNQKSVENYFNTNELSVTENKIQNFFNKLYRQNIDIVSALEGLNIPRLGNKTSQLFKDKKELIVDLIRYSEMLHQNIEDAELRTQILASLENLVKGVTTKNIFDNFDKFYNLKFIGIDRLIFSNSNNDLRFIAVTGNLNKMSRKQFNIYINQYGYDLSSNLKKCDYLVCNNLNSNSTKIKQARDNKIKIITEDEFYKILNGDILN